jgi:hypothetical protein
MSIAADADPQRLTRLGRRLRRVREQDGQAGEKRRQAHDAQLDCGFWVRISGAIQANHYAIGNTREERVQRRL